MKNQSFTKIFATILVVGSLLAALLLSTAASTPAAVRSEWPGNSFIPVLLNAWPTPQPARLLFSEVVYDPDGPEPGGEWIEIYNAGGSPVELGTCKLGDEETQGEQEGMYTFPPGAQLQPGEVIVVAGQAAIFLALYGQLPDFELRESDPLVPDMVRHTAWAGGSVELGNTGDELLLLDGNDHLIDALSWGSSTFAFDPHIPLAAGGHSLERFPAGFDSDTAEDWREQESPSPGTVPDLAPTPSPTSGATPTTLPSGALVLNEIHADPHSQNGDANGDGVVSSTADEFVEIVNTLPMSVDLSGWSLQDMLRPRHVFPPGSLVPAGCAVVLFGGGNPTGTFGGSLVQTASGKAIALNNDGDALKLLDLSGSVVISYTYGLEGGKDQSLTRYPDVSGPEPLVLHAEALGSGGALFSPGLGVDGSPFTGCPEIK